MLIACYCIKICLKHEWKMTTMAIYEIVTFISICHDSMLSPPPSHVIRGLVPLSRAVFFMAELETPNNFCPSRFSHECTDFPFLPNANLYRKRKPVP